MASLSNNTRMTFQQFRAKMQEERRLKRTRVKSSIPAHKRCSALRKDGEKCTRRRKDESIFCGTHIKGTPHAKKSVIHSAFEDNSDPAKGISLVIPRVFNNIGWRRIKQIFINLNWGFVERVDVIPVQGDKFKRAFVHFAPGRWNTRNPEAMAALDALINGQLVKIIYDEPWFWNVSISRAKKPLEVPRPKSRPEVVTESKPTSSGASKKNNTKKNNNNTRRNRQRKERANAAQKRLNETRKQNGGIKRHHRGIDGKYHIDGKSFEVLEGSRAQVMHGTAYKTSGGLTRVHLMFNKHGRIISKSKKSAKGQMMLKILSDKGYFTRKGANSVRERRRRTNKKNNPSIVSKSIGREKETANAAQKRLNKTRKQNAGRRKKRKTWKQKTKRKTRRKNK